MIEEIILQHKAEKEKILLKQYVEREALGKSRQVLTSNLIKIVTGPRRAGKSIFSMLLLKTRDFAYLNFDDENLLKVSNYDKILEGLFSVYGNVQILFFDEIQNLTQWELFVNKLHRRGYQLLLTGSNAKLLSKEFSTALTGRYVSMEILPFSFREILLAIGFSDNFSKIQLPEQKGILLKHLRSYLENGGYPEPIVTSGLDIRSYLKTLLEATIFKDVVKRYKIKYPQDIYHLALYLISNFCCEYSLNSIMKALSFRSTRTVQNYLGYLEETYLFFSLTRFSPKFKQQLKAPRKVYLVDNGYITANAFQLSDNMGRMMENSVFIELLRTGYRPNFELFYYKTRNNKEVDFIVKKGSQVMLMIQACYDISEGDTKQREIRALLEAHSELNCVDMQIITFDYEAIEKHHGKEIKFIPLWKWLLSH